MALLLWVLTAIALGTAIYSAMTDNYNKITDFLVYGSVVTGILIILFLI